MNSMKKLLTIFLFISLVGCTHKEELSADQKLYLTAKVWGFLKYYHPGVNNSPINWDNELIATLKKLPDVNNKEELSTLYIHWIESLGEVELAQPRDESKNSNSFDKNFNLSWFENTFFTKDLTDRLRYIEKNRSQKLQYVTEGYVGQIEITNEPHYAASQWSDQNIRLITLFRYWNVIEYFYPYKYKIDKGWDDLLHYFIPKFVDVKTEVDYHLLICELAASLCDSHSFFVTDLIRNYAGNKFIPAKFSILHKKAVITGFYDDSLARVDDIQLGDVILEVNNIPVYDVYLKNKKYIGGSNEAIKELGNSWRWIFNGGTDTVNITFERGGIVKEKTIRRYTYSTFKPVEPTPVKWKKINTSIGYVNMEEDRVMAEDLPTMMKELEDTKAIIFDFRTYPEFIIDELLEYLNPEPREAAKAIQPDLTYPGRFTWTAPVLVGKHNPGPYKGKVIILVNDDTQSRSEYFVMAMQTVDGSITIGRQTSGADGDVLAYTFFDEKTSWITGRGIFYPDGKETQRVGIAIDIEVPLTIEDIAKGRDAILEKAIETAMKVN